MAQTFAKFDKFIGKTLLGTVTPVNLNTDALKVALISNALTALTGTLEASATKLADLTEVTGNGATAGGIDTVNSFAESTATPGKWVVASTASPQWTATGAISGITAVVLHDSDTTTPANAVIGYWPDSTTRTLATSDTYTVTFASSTIFTIA